MTLTSPLAPLLSRRLLGDVTDAAQQEAFILVENNYLHDIAVEYKLQHKCQLLSLFYWKCRNNGELSLKKDTFY